MTIHFSIIIITFFYVCARVGYDHGPQVPDPRAGEWLEYMEGHERWWDAVWRAAKDNGQEVVTMTPEHGPPNYQVTISNVVIISLTQSLDL